jgi:hypothetical protein
MLYSTVFTAKIKALPYNDTEGHITLSGDVIKVTQLCCPGALSTAVMINTKRNLISGKISP